MKLNPIRAIRLFFAIAFFCGAAAAVPIQIKPFGTVPIPEDSVRYVPLKSHFIESEAGVELAFTAKVLSGSLEATMESDTLVLVPARDWHGSFQVEISVLGNAAPALKVVLNGSVRSVNDAPGSVQTFDLILTEDVPSQVRVQDYFRDVDGTITEIKAKSDSLQIQVAEGTMTFTGKQDVSLRQPFEVTLKDDSGAIVTYGFHIFISPVNDAPRETGVLPAAARPNNDTFAVDLGAYFRDPDSPAPELRVVMDPVAGIRYALAGTRLTVIPFLGIAPFAVSGRIMDDQSAATAFSFQYDPNQALSNGMASLWSNANHETRSIAYQPSVHLRADSSLNVFTLTDTGVVLDHFGKDGRKTRPPTVLREHGSDSVRYLNVVREDGYFLLKLQLDDSVGNPAKEFILMDDTLRIMARKKVVRPEWLSDIKMDLPNKRFVACYQGQDALARMFFNAEIFDFDFNSVAHNRLYMAFEAVDSFYVNPNRYPPQVEPKPFTPYAAGLTVAVLPDQYAFFWHQETRGSRFNHQIFHLTASKDLETLGEPGRLDAYAAGDAQYFLNDIRDVRAITRQKDIYLTWTTTMMDSSRNSFRSSHVSLAKLDASIALAAPFRILNTGSGYDTRQQSTAFQDGKILARWISKFAEERNVFGWQWLDLDLKTLGDTGYVEDANPSWPEYHFAAGKASYMTRLHSDGRFLGEWINGLGTIPIVDPPLSLRRTLSPRQKARLMISSRVLFTRPGAPGGPGMDALGRNAPVRPIASKAP